MLSKVKRMKYSASFKLQVVKFASDNSNNSAASRKFGIDKKLVWKVRLEKEDWQHKVSAENQMCRSWQEVPVAWAREKGRQMGRGKQKEWARRDKKSDPFARQKNRTTNEYRQFPRLKWVVHSVQNLLL